ncbi:MAG: carboxypeptidase regulatory-like domain-containing protein [bacterium]
MRFGLFFKVFALVAISFAFLWAPSLAADGPTFGTKILIAEGMKISQGKDTVFGATAGGAITGKVSSDSDGGPISEAWVVASGAPEGEVVGWAVSGWDGTYLIAGLAPGEYYVAASARGYLSEYYDDVTEPEEATPVAVPDSGTAADIDFSLTFHGPHHGEGSISGRVFDDSTGKPIEGAHVLAVTSLCLSDDPSCSDSLFWMGEAITGPGGMYQIEGLITGDYIVSVSAYGYLPEFYDDVYHPDEATPVHVEEPNNTPQINFGLSKFVPGRGSISGTVLAEADSTPIGDAWVMAYSPTNPFSAGAAATKPDGGYRIERLMSSDYYVVARAPEFHAEWYDNVKTEQEATLVPVTSPEETPEIDFYLGYLGSISGRVTSESDGSPIVGARVCAFPANDMPNIFPGSDYELWPRCAATDTSGEYTIKGLPSGEYYVGVWACGYLSEWYDGVRGRDEATPVTVEEEEETPDIHFALSTGGSISGRVVSELDGAPVPSARVCVTPLADSTDWPGLFPWPDDVLWDRCRCALTDADGRYVVAGLVSGNYYVHVWAEGFLPEWYDGVQFEEEATPVTVVESEQTPDIDFALSTGGSISGQVVAESDGHPIPRARVCVFSALDSAWLPLSVLWPPDEDMPFGTMRCVETDRDGGYRVDKLYTGDYFVVAWAETFLPEWYEEAAGWEEATPVAVIDPEETPGIDFTLSKGGSISGRVISRNASGEEGSPIHGATVCAFHLFDAAVEPEISPSGFARCAVTDEHGRYTITGLKSGFYLVVASAWGYEEQWYDHVRNPREATPVEVLAPEQTPDINFGLRPWGGEASITGRVVDEKDGHPIPEAYVEARRGDGWWTGRALTREDGTYVIADLPSGNYYVSVKAKGYIAEFYDNVRDPKEATYVEVVEPLNTPDINFELERRSSQFVGGIAGTVTADSDTTPIDEAFVLAFSLNSVGVRNEAVGVAVTDESGHYTITDLPGGQYVVLCFAEGYIGEIYDDVLDPKEATPVRVVPPDMTEGINFSLSPVLWEGGGSITGRIFEGDSSTPASEAWVYALDPDANPVAWDQTGPDGNYFLKGLAPGSYTVQASKVPFDAAYYGNATDFEGSTPVIVGVESVSGVNLVLRGATETAVEDDGDADLIPEGFALEQNYPNPFNPITSIQYSVVSDLFPPHVTLKIYNLLGQEVQRLVDEPQETGYYTVTWDGRDFSGQQVASGVYFCRLQAGEYASTIKMVLMK